MKPSIRITILLLCLAFPPTALSAQSRYNVNADIERAVREFFYKISEMNNPIEKLSPEDIAAAYQKDINTFYLNSDEIKMTSFLNWYKQYILKDHSITHVFKVTSIENYYGTSVYKVKGMLQRNIEDDLQQRIKDTPIEMTVIWRGKDYNSLSIRSIDFRMYLIPEDQITTNEYEFYINKNVSHLSSQGGAWEFELHSVINTKQGYFGEENRLIKSERAYYTYSTPDNININVDYFDVFSGYIPPNKEKDARCFLIKITQQGSGEVLRHYIYQEGKRKR